MAPLLHPGRSAPHSIGAHDRCQTAATFSFSPCQYAHAPPRPRTAPHNITHTNPLFPARSPVCIVPDPIRGGDDVLVMCDVLDPSGTPHPTNTRAKVRRCCSSTTGCQGGRARALFNGQARWPPPPVNLAGRPCSRSAPGASAAPVAGCPCCRSRPALLRAAQILCCSWAAGASPTACSRPHSTLGPSPPHCITTPLPPLPAAAGGHHQRQGGGGGPPVWV